MGYLTEYFQRRKAKKQHVRLSNIHDFRNTIPLLLESHVRLSNITIDVPEDCISSLSIGAYSYVRSQSHLMAVSEIGRFCSIGRNVVIGQDPRNHPIDWVSTSPAFNNGYDSSLTPTRIGHDVWIGHNAVILAGVEVGHGAVIGMNAVVTKDVAPYEIVAGNPARPIRYRFSEDIINALLASHWWDYSFQQLKQLDFSHPEHFIQQMDKLTEKVDYPVLTIQNKKVSL
jgi:acetyltransferase-like isoleucine patch superfamily enzyme